MADAKDWSEVSRFNRALTAGGFAPGPTHSINNSRFDHAHPIKSSLVVGLWIGHDAL